jgi:hypothetical protein
VMVSFNAIGAQFPAFQAFDMIVDNDLDGVADRTCAGNTSLLCSTDLDCGANAPCRSEVFLWCENTGLNLPPNSVPWNYSLDVSLIRAGSTTRVQLIRGLEDNLARNMTPYNTQTNPGNVLPKAPVTIFGLRVVFSNPRVLSSADRVVVEANRNPLFDLIGGLPPGQPAPGICFDSAFPGNPRIVPPTSKDPDFPLSELGSGFSVDLNKGDTLIVKARIVDDPITGFPAITAEPNLFATLVVDGAQVQFAGSELSNFANGTGISFSFTSR